MNPYYQFSMIDGVRTAEAKIIESDKRYSKPQKEQIIQESIITSPIKQPVIAYEPTPTRDPVSAIGDTSIMTKPATTINVYSPDGSTSTTSLADEVTVSDSGVSTSSKGGGGGGGGGGGISPSKPKSKASTPTKPKKSFIPLAAIGAGIAILILKPF
jgi:hypothetical protein